MSGKCAHGLSQQNANELWRKTLRRKLKKWFETQEAEREASQMEQRGEV